MDMIRDIHKLYCHLLYKAALMVHPATPRHTSRGNDFPDKHFLLVDRRGFGPGIFSYMQSYLAWVAYARENNLIPVLSMCKHRSIYHQKDEVGKINVWDCFFSQPTEYTLSSISRAKHVWVAKEGWVRNDPSTLPWIGPNEDLEADEKIKPWRALARETIRPNENNLKHFTSDALEKALPNGVIGVLARGTDYVKLRPNGHPVQPTVEMLLQAITSRLDAGCEKKVFLATEDQRIASALKSALKDKLILSNQEFCDYTGGFIGKSTSLNGNRKHGLAYLKAMVDVSRCQPFIGGRTSGTIGVTLMTKGFNYSKAFNLGVYQP